MKKKFWVLGLYEGKIKTTISNKPDCFFTIDRNMN